jgi:hypothetical protein
MLAGKEGRGFCQKLSLHLHSTFALLGIGRAGEVDEGCDGR